MFDNLCPDAIFFSIVWPSPNGLLPAFTREFYVGQDAATKKCSVSDKKPDGTKVMMVGKTSFKTKAEAEAAMKADKDCK